METKLSAYHKEVIHQPLKEGKISIIEKFPYTDNEMKEKLGRQISDLPLLRAFNFLPILDIKKESTHLEIHYEKFDYGSLDNLFVEIQKKNRYLSERAISIIIISILKPLNALHIMQYVHRNIYPCNIYFRSNGEIALGGLHLLIKVNELDQTKPRPGQISKDTPFGDYSNLGLIIYRLITNKQWEGQFPRNIDKIIDDVPTHLKKSILLDFMMKCFSPEDGINLMDDDYISQSNILYRDIRVIQHGHIVDSMFSDKDPTNIELLKPTDEIRQLESLGRGGFGEVYHVEVGRLHLAQKLVKDGKCDSRETQFCRKLVHDNIVNTFLPLCSTNPDEIPFLVYTELCKTSLTNFLNQMIGNKMYPSKFFIMKVICGIINALCWIHKVNLVHRDVKPDNVLITKGGTIVLCDLGCIGTADENHFHRTYMGSPYYMANEINGIDPYDQSVDIFSLGCLFYLLCKFQHPPETRKEFHADSYSWTPIKHYKRYEFMKKLTDSMRLPKDHRITIVQLYNDPLIKKYNATVREMPVYVNDQINPFMILDHPLPNSPCHELNNDKCILQCFDSPKIKFPGSEYTILNFPEKLNDQFIRDLSFIFPRMNLLKDHHLLKKFGVESFAFEMVKLIIRFLPLINFKLTVVHTKATVIVDNKFDDKWDWGSNYVVLEAIDNIFSILRYIVDKKSEIHNLNHHTLAVTLLTDFFKSLISLSYNNQHKFLYCEKMANKWFMTVTDNEASSDIEKFSKYYRDPELNQLLDQ